jgi:hypothetical protein
MLLEKINAVAATYWCTARLALHSTNWGYYPSGAFGTVLIILLILALLGRI